MLPKFYSGKTGIIVKNLINRSILFSRLFGLIFISLGLYNSLSGIEIQKPVQLSGLLLDRGFSYYFKGDFGNAAIYFERYIHQEGDQESPLRFLGQIYATKGDFKRSIDRLQRAIKVMPDSIDSHLLLAEVYLKVNKRDKSIKTLNTILEIDEFNIRALHFLAFLHQQKGDMRKASSYFKRIIIAAPMSLGNEREYLEQAFTFLGNYYYQKQDFLRAINYYENLIEIEPRNTRNLLVLGELYKITGQFEKSIVILQKLLVLNPGNMAARESIIETKYILNKPETKRDIEYFLKRNKNPHLSFSAFLLELKGDHEGSKKIIEKILKKIPNRLSLRICNYRNLNFLSQKKQSFVILARNEAYLVFSLAQRIGAHNLSREYASIVFNTMNRQNKNLDFTNNFFISKLHSKLSIEIEQLALDYIEFFSSYSETMEVLEERKPALVYRREAVRYAERLFQWYRVSKEKKKISLMNKKRYSNLIAYAWLLQKKKTNQPKKAIGLLNEAISIEPMQSNAFFVKGIVHYTNADKKNKFFNLNTSEKNFRKAISLTGKKGKNHGALPNYYFYYGMVLEKNGKWEKAKKALKTAIKLDPYNPVYLNYLGYMYSLRNENLPEAKNALLMALEDDPENEAYLDSYGWILFQMKKPEAALKRLLHADQEAEKKDNNDAVIYYHLGEVYTALGNSERAVYYYERALKFIEKSSEELDRIEIEKKIDRIKRHAKIAKPAENSADTK